MTMEEEEPNYRRIEVPWGKETVPVQLWPPESASGLAWDWPGSVRSEADAVAQLVEALRYKPEGRGFDSRWSHWNFSLIPKALVSTQPLTEMSTRNISWGVKAAGA
jgi:hypothetical protein